MESGRIIKRINDTNIETFANIEQVIGEKNRNAADDRYLLCPKNAGSIAGSVLK